MAIEITHEMAAKVLSTVDAGLCSGVGVAEPGRMCVEAAVCFALGEPHGDDPSCVSRALRTFKIKLNDARWSSNEARARGLRRLALIQLGSAGHLDDKEFVRRIAKLAIRKAVPAALRSAALIQENPQHKASLLEHAVICERDGTRKAAQNASASAASYAYAAASASATAYAAASADAYAAASAASADAYASYASAAAADADAAASAAASAASASASASAAGDYAYAYATRDKSLADFAEGVVQVLIQMKVPGIKWLVLAPIEIAE